MKFKLLHADEWSNDYLCPKCLQEFSISDDSSWHQQTTPECPLCECKEDETQEKVIESLNRQIDELKGENHRLSLHRDSTIDLTERTKLITKLKEKTGIQRAEDITHVALIHYLSFLEAKTLP